jgi:hypothetical protein
VNDDLGMMWKKLVVLQVYIWSECLPMQAVNKQDRQCTYKRKFETRSPNHCFHGKSINITHFECFCGLIYPAMRLRLIVLSSVFCLTVPYFSTLPHKRQNFGKILLNTKYAYWFLYNIQNCFSFFRRIQWDVNINVCRSSCKVSVILIRLKVCIFLTNFRKVLKFQISWKSVQWDPSFSMRTDRQIRGS